MKNQQAMRIPHGFTLIEALVTVAVLAILLSLGTPALQSFLERSAMQSLQSDFSGALQRARLDAISRNTCVSLCPLASSAAQGLACEIGGSARANWHQGWLMFVNPACTAPVGGIPAAADIIVARQPGNPRYRLVDQGGNVPALHTFNSRGVLRATGRTYLMSDAERDQSENARCLTLNMQGRLLISLPDDEGSCG